MEKGDPYRIKKNGGFLSYVLTVLDRAYAPAQSVSSKKALAIHMPVVAPAPAPHV